MLQMVIISTDKQMAYLQDNINEWLARAEKLNIKIHNIYMTSGMCTIFYYVEDGDEIKKIREKFNIK
jgi:hypothetical protein